MISRRFQYTALLSGLVVYFALAPSSASAQTVRFQTFDGPSVPLNGENETMPQWADGRGREGGEFSTSINSSSALSGRSLNIDLRHVPGTGNQLYADWRPWNYDDSNGSYDHLPAARNSARDYAIDAANWQFNTYNRMVFWIKTPNTAAPYANGGLSNYNVGTYTKKTVNPVYSQDESNNVHWYHFVNSE